MSLRKRNAQHDADARLLARVVAWAEAQRPAQSDSRAILQDVAWSGPWVTIGDGWAKIGRWSLATLSQQQQLVRAMFRSLRAGADALASSENAAVDDVPSVEVRLTFAVLPLPTTRRPGRVRNTVTGAPDDLLWFKLFELVERVGLDRLLACPACGRAFIKTGRREFCSVTCQKRIYMRALRASNRQKSAKGGRHGKATRTR